jgi:hypothetical protein
MNIDIYIQYPRVNLQKLQNRQNNIIYIAKSAGLWLFRVMQTPTKIYSYISFSIKQ